MPLPRTLEPEVMDTVEEAQAYDTMDHAAVNSAFVSDMIGAASQLLGLNLADRDDPRWPDDRRDDPSQPAEEFHAESFDLLDLGTGTAQIPIEICRGAPLARVMAADASRAMLQIAQINVDIAGLRGRIHLDLVDAKSLHYTDGMFLGVLSNSIVHHLADPRPALAEAVRVCRAGGLLFFRDLVRPADIATVERLVATHVERETPEQQQLFRQSLHAALSLEEVRELVTGLGYNPDQVSLTSDRHWTWAARRT